MSRIERAGKKYEQLFAAQITESKTDPELMNILQRLIFGEVFYIGNLDDKTRELITITVLVTNQTLPQLRSHTNAALNIGVTPIEIREVVYQLAAFLGFPIVLNALDTINQVFESRGISLPLENKSTVKEDDRFAKGQGQEFFLYGDSVKQSMSDLPEEFAKAVPTLLTEFCFGDLYTREGIDIKTREITILCSLAAMGGVDRPFVAHALANLKVGNTKETLVSAMIQALPYMGFPRTLNAINIIKEVKFEQ